MRGILLAAVLGFSGAPLYWLIATALESPDRIIVDRRTLAALANSLVVAGTVAVLATALGTLAGYGLARRRLGGFALPFGILTIRMVPVVVLIVPLFLMFRALGLIDSRLAVIAAHLTLALPFSVWLMRGFFCELPRELFDAALIDGCSPWQMLRRLALPLGMPGIATTAFFCFILSWNEFPLALVLSRKTATTLPVLIAGLGGSEMAVTALIGALPVLLVAALAARGLLRGLVIGTRA